VLTCRSAGPDSFTSQPPRIQCHWVFRHEHPAAGTYGNYAHMAQPITPAASQYLGDMDGDGQATVADAINILRIVAGLDFSDPLADTNESSEAATSVMRSKSCAVWWAWTTGRSAAGARLKAGMNSSPSGALRAPPLDSLTSPWVWLWMHTGMCT